MLNDALDKRRPSGHLTRLIIDALFTLNLPDFLTITLKDKEEGKEEKTDDDEDTQSGWHHNSLKKESNTRKFPKFLRNLVTFKGGFNLKDQN